MDAGITVDLGTWNRALVEYQAATRKDWAYVINRAMNNWAIQSQRFIAEAQESRIRHLTGLPWWPKLIARIMVRRAAGRAAKALAKTGGKVTAGRHAVTRFFGGHFYTRDQARRRSAKIINQRVNARRFLAAFFRIWSVAIMDKVPGLDKRGFMGGFPTSRFRRYIKAEYRPATSQNLSAFVRVWYEYRVRSGKGIAKVSAMFERAKARGLAAATQDMLRYAQSLAVKKWRS